MEVVAAAKHARSRACLACQKRKGKCDGNDPCSYCVKGKLECAYTTAKKRGPAPKKVKIGKFSIFASASEECQFIPEINVIQDEMTKQYQKNNCIDFYFHYVGFIFPVSQRIRLYTRPRKSSRKVQLYVIFAHVARVFGSNDLSVKCIEEARSYAGEAFDDVSMDSAVAFIMLSLYSGVDDPRGKYYASMAYNILKFPAIGTGAEVKEILRTASFMGLMQEPNISHDERFSIIVSGLANEQGSLTLKEWSTIINTRLASIYKWKIVKNDAQESLSIGIFCDATLISHETRELLENELGNLEELIENHAQELGVDLTAINNYYLHFGRMILAWKTGDRPKAVQLALYAARLIIREADNMLVWMHNYLPNMLCFAAILESYDYPEVAAELTTTLEEMCVKIGHKPKFDKLTQAWKVNIKLLKTIQVEADVDASPQEQTDPPESSSPSPLLTHSHTHSTHPSHTTHTSSPSKTRAPHSPHYETYTQLSPTHQGKNSPPSRHSPTRQLHAAGEKTMTNQHAIPISPHTSSIPSFRPLPIQTYTFPTHKLQNNNNNNNNSNNNNNNNNSTTIAQIGLTKQDYQYENTNTQMRQFDMATYNTLPTYQDAQQIFQKQQLSQTPQPLFSSYPQSLSHPPPQQNFMYPQLFQTSSYPSSSFVSSSSFLSSSPSPAHFTPPSPSSYQQLLANHTLLINDQPTYSYVPFPSTSTSLSSSSSPHSPSSLSPSPQQMTGNYHLPLN